MPGESMRNGIWLKMLTGVATCALGIAPTLHAAEASQKAANRPNFLVILVDDLGPEWIGCYGSGHRTPNIDRLAAQGLRFENAWATPLCTPTRHEMLTGRYPFRTGWSVHHDVPRWGPPYFDWEREVTFARVLRDAGYATAVVGKWQVNDFRTHPDALRRHGFDEHCMWTGFESDNPPAGERYFDPYIQENGRRGTRTGAFGPDVFTEYLVDFIKRHKDGPFLAYHAMVLTHTPFTKTPDNKNTSLEKAALHPGMVDYVDKNVGRLMETLQELGIRDRTIVIFTSDNGTVRGVLGKQNGRVVNGGKGTLFETGIHVPLIVSWPGHTPSGKATDELVDFSDFLPTIVELAGQKPPAGVTIDGRSLAGMLRGQDGGKPRRAWIFSELGNKRVVRNRRYKLWSSGEFYDLTADPAEEKSLADSQDPRIVTARKELQGVLASIPPVTKLPGLGEAKK